MKLPPFFWVVLTLTAAFWIGVIYVAAHFIDKFW